jgi:nitrogen fixation NifU-like protein
MSGELDALYQEIILDHHESPRNFGAVEKPDYMAEGFNPLCGDRVSLGLKIDSGRCVADIRFKGEGCSICMASASMMTDAVKGCALSDVSMKIQAFRDVLQGQRDAEILGEELRALEGVKRFPVRIKCALLPWTTLKDAIEKKEVVK